MDIFKLSKSLDELIYDVMMWIIFYPYTLLRVLSSPGGMIEYVSSELRKSDEDQLFDRGLSPPLFLFLSIILGWLLAPDITGELQKSGGGIVLKALADSSWNLLLYRLLIYCAFPLAGAMIYEWRTPGGISRASFRRPFYQQAYLCAPIALVISLGMVLLGTGEDELGAGITALVILASLMWYFWAQIVFFRRTMNAGWFSAIGLALLALVIGLAMFQLVSLITLR